MILNDGFSHPDQPWVPAEYREDPGVEVASQLHPRGRPSEVGSLTPPCQETPSQPDGF